STGTEGLLMAYDRINQGHAKRMLVGSCSDSGPYVWAGFDAMRILPRKFNDNPPAASRPMSATASGFVPASGAGALVLESLESAIERNVKIYAEVLGGAINSGGQRGGGTITAPNPVAVQRCIRSALEHAGVEAGEIDAINGHLTATAKDPEEVRNWKKALKLDSRSFPYLNSFKSTMGHGLAAAGSMECVGTVLQFERGEIFGNVNCEDLHPEIEKELSRKSIPLKSLGYEPKIIAKASFGFGDVNACVIFKAYKD
ncbi:MAG: beta-ketoacyl synthase N-terminal-like domain-containing protein, partial [Flavobacteriaceae bacterium]